MTKELQNKEIENVSGGDYFETRETKWDNDVTYRYNVGDSVEVYRTFFHGSTKHAVILSRAVHYNTGVMSSTCEPAYKVRYDDGKTDKVKECHIQNPKNL